MTNEHIVILKKIPVDPKHVGALRIGVSRTPPREPESFEAQRTPFFERGVFRFAAFLLSLTFLVNPVAVAYAEEVEPIFPVDAPPSAAQEQVSPALDEQPQSDAPLPTVDEPATLPETPAESDVPSVEVPSDDFSETVDALLASSTDTTGTTTNAHESETAGTTEDTSNATSTDTSIQATSSNNGVSVIDFSASSTDEDSAESPVESEVSPEPSDVALPTRLPTPEEIAAERQAAQAILREQIRQEVKAELRAQCVSYSNDGYYCVDDESSHDISARPPVYRVVSEHGIAGTDADIVIVRDLPEGVSQEVVTDNAVDDLFPNADADLRMITWQSLVDGRWQIAYKEGTSTAQYLTANVYGNAHPATDGKRIVWQSWIGENWEIMYAEESASASVADGISSATSTGVDGIHPGWRTVRLSENGVHDMFPKIAGNIVTWQEKGEKGWNIVMFDLSSMTKRVVDTEGVPGEDPTLAVLYKERTADGSVVFRARDLATGREIPIGGNQGQAPVRLPIPEQQGALPVNNASSTSVTVKPEGDGDTPPTPEA